MSSCARRVDAHPYAIVRAYSIWLIASYDVLPQKRRRGGHACLGRPLGVEEEAVFVKIQHGNFEEPRDGQQRP